MHHIIFVGCYIDCIYGKPFAKSGEDGTINIQCNQFTQIFNFCSAFFSFFGS